MDMNQWLAIICGVLIQETQLNLFFLNEICGISIYLVPSPTPHFSGNHENNSLNSWYQWKQKGPHPQRIVIICFD